MPLTPIAWPESECCCKNPITGISCRLGHVAIHTGDGTKTLFGAYSHSKITTVEQARQIEASFFYLQTGLEIFYLGQLVRQNSLAAYWDDYGRKTLTSALGVLYQGVLEYIPTADSSIIQYRDNEISGVLPRINSASNNSYVKAGEEGQIIRTNVRYCYNIYGASSTRQETYELIDNVSSTNSTFIHGTSVGWTGSILQALQAANSGTTINTISGEAVGPYLLYSIAAGSGGSNWNGLLFYRAQLVSTTFNGHLAAITNTENYVAQTNASGIYEYFAGFMYTSPAIIPNTYTPGGFYTTVWARNKSLLFRSAPKNSVYGTTSYISYYYEGVLVETVNVTARPLASSSPITNGDEYTLARFSDGTGILWYKNSKIYDGIVYSSRNSLGTGTSNEVAVLCTAYNSTLLEYSVRLFVGGVQVGATPVYSAGIDPYGFIIVSNGTYLIFNLAGATLGSGYETAVKIVDGSWLFYTASSGAGAWFLHGVKRYETDGSVEKLTGVTGSFWQSNVSSEPTYYYLQIRVSIVLQNVLFYGATRIGQGRTITGFLSNSQYGDKWLIAATPAVTNGVLVFYENLIAWEGAVTGKAFWDIASYPMTRDYIFVPKNSATGIVLYHGQIVYEGPWISAVACFCAWDSLDSGADVGLAVYDQLAVVDTETSFILGNGVFGLTRYSTAAWNPIPFVPSTVLPMVPSFSAPSTLSGEVIDVEFLPQKFQVDPVPPDFPSWFQRVCNLAATLSDFAQDGFRLSDEAEWRRRFDICRDCSLFFGNRCSRCGCYPSVKSRLGAARCPEGRWDLNRGGAEIAEREEEILWD